MLCHYCHSPCPLTNVSTWTCKVCDVEFHPGHINMFTYIKGEKYTFQIRYEHTEFPARIICPYKFDVSSLTNMRDNIINLPKIPENITPENVNEKVRLYLLFS